MTGRWELIAYRFNELAIVALSNSMMTIPTLELLRFLPFEMEPSPIKSFDHTVVEDVQPDGFRVLWTGL